MSMDTVLRHGAGPAGTAYRSRTVCDHGHVMMSSCSGPGYAVTRAARLATPPVHDALTLFRGARG